MNKKIRTIVQYLFFLGLGLFFAWLSLKSLNEDNTKQIKEAIIHARHWLAVPVFIVLIGSHYIRALRWRLLLEPMGFQPRVTNSFFAVMIGYLVNLGVPRLGEIVKCTVLSRYEKIPADKLIGTIIVERMIDALTLLLVFGITLGIQPELYSRILSAFFKQDTGAGKKDAPVLLITLLIAGAALLLVAAWMLIRKKTINDLLGIIRKITGSVLQGVSTIRHLKKRKAFLFLTLLLWICYLGGGYIGFMAFRETAIYGIREAFTILSAGSIGMIASPGGIGAYALLIDQTMQLYGLNSSIAVAFGWILWLAQTAVILLGGVLSFALLPWINKKRNHATS